MIASATRGLASIVLLVLGCGTETPPSPTPAVVAPAESPSAAEPVVPAAPTPVVAEPVTTPVRRRSTPDERAARRAAVDEARARARADAWSEALTLFEQALALDPHDPRLRCETGYAAYRAGRIEEAERYIGAAESALPEPAATAPALRVPTAMCLYNAGLIHEARGRTDAARSAFIASLSLRPNATVEAHLDRLGGAPAHVDGVLAFRGLDDDAVDARVWEAACGDTALRCTPGHHVDEGDEWDITNTIVPAPSRDESNAPFAARLLRFELHAPGWGTEGVNRVANWLVVREGAMAMAGRISEAWTTETVDCGDASEPRFEWVDLVPGGSPELLVDATACSASEGACEGASNLERLVVICTGGPMRCAQLSLTQESETSSYDDCEGAGGGGEESIGHHGYRIDADFDRGSIALRPTFGDAPIPSLLGAHPIAELFDRPEVRWSEPSP